MSSHQDCNFANHPHRTRIQKKFATEVGRSCRLFRDENEPPTIFNWHLGLPIDKATLKDSSSSYKLKRWVIEDTIKTADHVCCLATVKLVILRAFLAK